MMVITHVAIGLLAALPVALSMPEFATAAAVGAVIGGVFPDLDLVAGEHRRTLHFPVIGPLLALPVIIVALLVPSNLTVGGAMAVTAAAVHSTSDVLGAGEELRPWERTSTNAVYDHVSGRWWRARYVIPYDGSSRDLVVAVLAAVPPLSVYDGPVRWVLLGLLGVAGIYTLFRRRLAPYFEAIV
ncbi:MAG: metal-dependent hydrolase [Halolamina sp.]|uniref:metal-dependent hydrolase n=1 Tax=Halolamina sp. TaxID=1940283 RepID=UPI002FC3ADD4